MMAGARAAIRQGRLTAMCEQVRELWDTPVH
jgi:hypothetical protein